MWWMGCCINLLYHSYYCWLVLPAAGSFVDAPAGRWSPVGRPWLTGLVTPSWSLVLTWQRCLGPPYSDGAWGLHALPTQTTHGRAPAHTKKRTNTNSRERKKQVQMPLKNFESVQSFFLFLRLLAYSVKCQCKKKNVSVSLSNGWNWLKKNFLNSFFLIQQIWTQQEKITYFTAQEVFHCFRPFHCCLSVVLWPEKGDFPENLHRVVYVIINRRSFESLIVWIWHNITFSLLMLVTKLAEDRGVSVGNKAMSSIMLWFIQHSWWWLKGVTDADKGSRSI